MSLAWSARGIGGVVGALGGGFLFKHTHPYISFLANSIFGLIVALNSIYMPDNVEDDGDFFNDDETVISRIKENYQRIKTSISTRQVYSMLLFFIINSLISPVFTQFQYYFLTDVAKITDVQFAGYQMLSQLMHIVGSIIYQERFKNVEPRTLMYYACYVCIISNFCSLSQAKRWNL